MNKIAVIWDLDGTLLDSYGVIVSSLHQIYLEKGISLDKQEILHDVINESVSAFIYKMEQKYGVPFDDLKDRYSIISGQERLNIKAMNHAFEILEALKNKGIPSYVFTHRGATTESVLKNIGIYDYFTELVTSLNGFKRKPDAEGLEYLINKYQLDKERTYYVGDRPMDIICANNARIKSILFIPNKDILIPSGKETYVVHDLLEILDIVK